MINAACGLLANPCHVGIHTDGTGGRTLQIPGVKRARGQMVVYLGWSRS